MRPLPARTSRAARAAVALLVLPAATVVAAAAVASPAAAQEQTPPPAAANPPVGNPPPATPPDTNPPGTNPPGAPAPTPGPITVTVNGQPILFGAQPPVEQEGFVLVPLRGVFEKLGATVQYATATRTVTAVRGDTTVTLRLGDPYAYINGAPRPLAVVPQAASGTTLVPLRFVSEALGAQVSWNKDTRTVEITTGPPTVDQLPTPPGTDPVLGTITGLMPESGAVTLRVSTGENDRLPLAPDATLLVKSADNAPETATPINTLKIGDQITATRDDQGRATVLRLRTDQRRGKVKQIGVADSNGDSPVTLTDGTVITVAAGAPVAMGDRTLQLSDILPDQSVVIRLDPKTGKGAGVAVATDDDPNPTPPLKLEIAGVSVGSEGNRTLRAGDTVTVRLTGTPGVKAAFSVSGLPDSQNVPMAETTPGNYSGTFTVPRDVTLPNATVAATLSRGDNTIAPVQAPTVLNVDSAPPNLESLAPADGATVADARPLIYGTFADPGSGVDPKSFHLILDGADVTARAQVTNGFFSYKPLADLPAGTHKLALSVRDTAGNEAQRSWTFVISGAVNPIHSLTITPDDGAPLSVGSTVQVRLDAAPGGSATFRIGNVMPDQPMTDVGGGSYIGTYTVKSGDSVSQAPVAVRYTPPAGGAPVVQIATATVTFVGGAPPIPIIDAPIEGARVGSSAAITGHGIPGGTVHVTVAYSGKMLLLSSQGKLFDADVVADAEGKWTTGSISLNVPSGVSGVNLTVTAVAVGADGSRSDAATVHFKR